MPIASNPNQRIKLSLATDMEIPEDKRPVFIFRYLTNAEWKYLSRISDTIESGTKSAADLYEKMEDALEDVLAGWENMTGTDGKPAKFNTAGLTNIINPSETWELVFELLGRVRPEVEDLKKSESPSSSA